jgi:gliding motility-associated-like protein
MQHFMKKRNITLLFLLLIVQLSFAQRQWTWIDGSKGTDAHGNYGTLGAPAASNTPGSRMGACTWKDKQGNLWLFGGRGLGESSSGLLSDLWKYDPSNRQWTWMGGEKTSNTQGQYGIFGLPIFQFPGARENAVAWTDDQGNFWLFGGAGFAANDEIGFLNDLWKYSTSFNTWSWVGGSNRLNQEGSYGERGQSSASNLPGGRFQSTAWVDNSGNFWLFGGFGYAKDKLGPLNDLWKLTPGNGEWTWLKGSKSEDDDAHYGQQGDFADDNTPGARQGATGWVDNDGRLWLFGGERKNRYYGDLWTYDLQKNQWAWTSGTKESNEMPVFEDVGLPTADGHPGTRSEASGWVDPTGDLWLFGGRGYGGDGGVNALNNIWKYSIANNNWTLIKGEARQSAVAVYGTQGTPDNSNKPGGTNNASAWTANDGTFWLFGGRSDDGFLNQVWNFTPCESGTISPESAAICEGSSQELNVTGGISYEWRLNGEVIAGENKSKLVATETGTYSVVIKNGSCAVNAYNTVEITRATAPSGSITPASATICQGGSKILTATGGTSYEWKRNGVTLGGQNKSTLTVTEAGTYSVIITNGTCSGPASNTVEITQESAPAGTISPTSASLCDNDSQVLTATGGTSYEWMRNGELINGQTGATITVTTAGTYSVIVKGGACSGPATNTVEVTDENSTGIRYPDLIATVNVPVQLNARNAGTQFQWTPSIGLNDPSSASPMATLSRDQEYQVLISSQGECSVVDTQFVKVVPDSGNVAKIFVPTAFTPNGNSVNDRLRPLGQIGKIDYFRIYNRWGNMLFQTNIVGEGWDGRFKGVVQQSDTYTWILSAKTPDGKPVKMSGKTVLIR